MDNATIWKIIDTYFNDNPQALVSHHIDSYDDFYKTGIYQIFKEKNPVRLYSRLDPATNEYMSYCNLYMGGKDGSKIYFGKPVIHDERNVHYMFPNEARLRNMSYSMTIHYDIDVEFVDILRPGEDPTLIGGEMVQEIHGGAIESSYDEHDQSLKFVNLSTLLATEQVGGEIDHQGGGPKPTAHKKKQAATDAIKLKMTTQAAQRLREMSKTSMSGNTQTRWHTLDKVYLGKFPVMLQSAFCILHGLPKEMRHSMGECRNDIGGYFIVDGKEKTVIAQEKFADNMLYIRDVHDDKYLYSAEIRSVSENASKPVRTLSVKIGTPSSKYTNHQIVVNIPNVRAPVPLFIVFRALGIISDKDIISHCLLDLDKYESMVDQFIPSVHDAATILNQQTALQYIALLTKGKGITHALEILSDYFLPHVGETNYIPKAYALGDMVFRLLSVHMGWAKPTDRDNFKYKRVELVGSLMYDLFREYWSIQLRQIHLDFEKRLYFNQEMYENNLFGLITQNYQDVFKERALEAGFRKAFKGNWGAQTHTKRVGIVQDLNRLSFNSALNHLRKTNLPLDSSVKLVGPRVLHNSQWGYIDPIDTPDGGSIGLHKHLSISTYITRGVSREPMLAWLREKWGMKLVEEYSPRALSQVTKVFVNGYLAGAVDEPIGCIDKFKLYRRNALIPIYASASFDIRLNTIFVYTDGGRLCRPIFYRDDQTGKTSYQYKTTLKRLQDGEFTWTDLISGFNKKREAASFNPTEMRIYELYELYEGIEAETNPAKLERFLKDKAVLDYIDNSESEHALIALDTESFETGRVESEENSNQPITKLPKSHTHCEIHNSLIFGMMSNMIIFPENNPATRNSFSCGQSKQACSTYHTNYQVRMDKTAVLLNSGQIPLVKSRFLDHITHEENSYGENAIVAIACYTGYNVEDAILVNEGALKRGLFRTTYFSCYEAHEETTKNGSSLVDKHFMDISKEPLVMGTKSGYDYSKLDQFGVIKEGTIVNDKTVLIGLASVNSHPPGSAIDAVPTYTDGSKTPKKGQLGIVDRVFITDDESGSRIAKVRVLEQRIPTLGDKMASRAGQKGTIGMVIPECDMPFTADGIRPDLIINPHALPTRMTIGQLVECITGKACAIYGGFGDCTAFNNKGSKIGVFGQLLTKQGYHSNGNEILYNGMTGEQLETEIFMGPTYYMRLKHMVKDKINYRALGPRTALTKQPVSGRANDGGLRIGEMERDTVISHGMTDFLRESMMERGDKSYLAVCNHTGMIAIYNPSKGLFVSPMADGPLKYVGSLEGEDVRLEHVTKYGRSFSIVCIPYSFKLLIQELQTINAQVRIITEDNINQIENMSYSQNIQTLTGDSNMTPAGLMRAIQERIQSKHSARLFTPMEMTPQEESLMKEANTVFAVDSTPDSPPYAPPDSPMDSPPYAPYSPVSLGKDYIAAPLLDSDSPKYNANSPYVSPVDAGNTSPTYNPNSPYVSPGQLGGSREADDEARYKLGERVCLRNCKDGHPTRAWEVSHIGPKFITLRAIDKSGLSDENSIRVVSAFDIFPEEHAHAYHAKHMAAQHNIVPMRMDQPYSVSAIPGNPAAPTIVIAPKFFNGNGSDHSTGVEPSNNAGDYNSIVPETMSDIVVKANIASEPRSEPIETLDLSKPIIVKKQQ
jgi:DNA-directed RNA polymerase II subunit RPB2